MEDSDDMEELDREMGELDKEEETPVDEKLWDPEDEDHSVSWSRFFMMSVLSDAVTVSQSHAQHDFSLCVWSIECVDAVYDVSFYFLFGSVKSVQKYSKVSKNIRKRSKRFKSVQKDSKMFKKDPKCPKRFKNVQKDPKCPKRSKSIQKRSKNIQKDSNSVQKDSKMFKKIQSVQKDSKMFKKIQSVQRSKSVQKDQKVSKKIQKVSKDTLRNEQDDQKDQKERFEKDNVLDTKDHFLHFLSSMFDAFVRLLIKGLIFYSQTCRKSTCLGQRFFFIYVIYKSVFFWLEYPRTRDLGLAESCNFARS